MRQARTNTRRNVDIKIGCETHNLGMMLPSTAVKKAHVMVRDWVRARYYNCGWNTEVTANVMIGGCVYASIWGFKQNNAIKIVHL